VSGTWFDTHGQACRTISFVIKESCSPYPRPCGLEYRPPLIHETAYVGPNVMRPPGGLPTAGQRHGRERRPAVRPWTTRDITSIAGNRPTRNRTS